MPAAVGDGRRRHPLSSHGSVKSRCDRSAIRTSRVSTRPSFNIIHSLDPARSLGIPRDSLRKERPMTRLQYRRRCRCARGGFTYIELLVVIFVILIVIAF